MTTKFYNKDYPRPQFVRNEWVDLNGEWDFSFDDNQAGESEQWYVQKQFPAGTKIKVPFTYETQASGIGIETFHPLVWYRRSVQIPRKQKESGAFCIFREWIIAQNVG